MSRLAPLAGALIGALGGAVYWLGAQVWPANVALILAMAATSLLAFRIRGTAPAPGTGLLSWLFFVLIKYNTLMALSSAQLPFAVPANLTLGFIMICGYAASYALPVLGAAARPKKPAKNLSALDLCLALLIGFAPAAFMGIPGLTGLAAALIVSMGFVAFAGDTPDLRQPLAEVGFYLGALASWRFI
jgi:cobalamin synthase